MENVFGWLLPSHELLAGWMVREVTGMGNFGLFLMEKQFGLPRSDEIENFDVVLRTEPDELRNALSEFEIWYNKNLQEFESRYPKTSKVVWDIYRKEDSIARSRFLSAKIDNGEPDEVFAERYRISSHRGVEPKDLVGAGVVSMLGHDPDYMGGVGKYEFMTRAGKVRTEIWDLRKDEIPWFEYTKKGV